MNYLTDMFALSEWEMNSLTERFFFDRVGNELSNLYVCFDRVGNELSNRYVWFVCVGN